MFKNRFGLPMNLQLFAADTGAGEGGGNGDGDKGGDNSDANKGADKNTEPSIPKSRFDEINNKYKETQGKLDEVLKKIADEDKARQAKDDEEAAKKGEFETLYNKTKGDADKYKGDAKVAGERVQALEAVINGLLETKLAAIPEDFRDLVPSNLTPEAKLAWVDAAEAKGLFGGKQREETTVGEQTNPNNNAQTQDTSKLSPMQKLLAGYGRK